MRKLTSLIDGNVLKEDRRSTELHRNIKLNLCSGILHTYGQRGSHTTRAFPGDKPEKLLQREVSEEVLEQSGCLKSHKWPGLYGTRTRLPEESDQLQTPKCNFILVWKVTDGTPIHTKISVVIWTAYGQWV